MESGITAFRLCDLHLPFAIFLLPCLLTGCAAIGIAAYKLSGPPTIPAKYTPQQVPTLVLVENYQHQSTSNAQAETLARQLVDDFGDKKVAPLIPIDKVQELRDAKPAEFPTMTITQIAKALGAQQVIYVELKTLDVTPLAGGGAYTGEAAALVKVVNGETGALLWPIETNEGYAVGARTNLVTKSYPNPADVRMVLYAQLTEQISHLFHKWQADTDYETSRKEWE